MPGWYVLNVASIPTVLQCLGVCHLFSCRCSVKAVLPFFYCVKACFKVRADNTSVQKQAKHPESIAVFKGDRNAALN